VPLPSAYALMRDETAVDQVQTCGSSGHASV